MTAPPAAAVQLLLGLLAHHNGFLTDEQLLAAWPAWLDDRRVPLLERLRSANLLAHEDTNALVRVLNRFVKRHGGVAASLAALAPNADLVVALRRLGDAETDALLAGLGGTQPIDPYGTVAHVATVAAIAPIRYTVLRHLVDGKPIRASKKSAEWCLKGVDQCWKMKQNAIRARECKEAQAAYEQARAIYRAIAKESFED